MLSEIERLTRYIVCGRVTKRPIFEFVDPAIHPNDSLTVFPLEDDYSFGILQSDTHWRWFIERCSTLKREPRYTSNTVFDSFPWPQAPSLKAVRKVAAAAVALRQLRREVKGEHGMSFRELYRALELPGASPIKDAHAVLDAAVREAYGMSKTEDALAFLLDLNRRVAEQEEAGAAVVGPGLPPCVIDPTALVTDDCIAFEVAQGARIVS